MLLLPYPKLAVKYGTDDVQVFQISNAAGTGMPTLGSVIKVGSNLQAISADRTSNIWLAGSSITDDSITSDMYTIKAGSTTATPVTGLSMASGAQILSGAPLHIHRSPCRCNDIALR